MTEQTPLERAARAMVECENEMNNGPIVTNEEWYNRLARAVIEAIREPDEVMVAAGVKGLSDYGLDDVQDGDAIAAFTSMIDAILAPQPKE